jgi:HlyD family secretion protein
MAKKKKSVGKVITWVVIVIVVIAAILFIASRRNRTNYTDVSTTTGNITTYYSFPGTIAAKNSQTLYADKAMQIKAINVTAGQSVKKDDVLMTTTAGENITAPFDGVVSDIYAVQNAQQMPGAQLCKIVDYTNLELDVQVDEYDLPAISDGKAATITLNALNKDVSGTVTHIDQEGISQGGVTYFNATVSLPVESDLRVGMTAQAKVLNQSEKGITILPMSAIQFDADNNSYVYMQGAKKVAEKVSVTLGINDGTNVEVKSGLKSGDTVLVPAAATATTGFGAMRSNSNQASTQDSNNSTTSGTGNSVSGGGNG